MFKKNHLYYALPAVLVSTLAVIAIVFAWQEPGDVPPLDNVPAPVNVGSYFQSKSGPLTVRGQFIAATSTFLATDGGRVGIGLINPNNLIQVKDLISFVNSREGWYAANTALGYEALRNPTFNYNTWDGVANTAVGYMSLRNNTTGSYNAALGDEVLRSNLDGNHNVGMGHHVLINNRSGTANTAIGSNAMFDNQTGGSNTAIGYGSLSSNLGSMNTALGKESLRVNTSGQENTAVGNTAMRNNTTGNSNTAVGAGALSTNTIGSNNTALGYLANVTSNNFTNATAIGYEAQASCSNCLILGNTNTNVGIGTSNPGTKLEVAGQVKITGGSPGLGKVLTSDATGLATWQTPSGGGGGFTVSTVSCDRTAASSVSCTATCPAGTIRVGCSSYGCTTGGALLSATGAYPDGSRGCACLTCCGGGSGNATVICYAYCATIN